MSLDLAPWLFVGLVVAGLIKVFVPLSWVAKVMGRRGFRSTFWASLIGAPLPLCSCSVLPVAIGLRRQGASRSATAAFLVSTPQNGLDAMAVTYAMLGPLMTIVRPIAAILDAIAVGLAVSVTTRRLPEASDPKDDSTDAACEQGDACCASTIPLSQAQPVKSCCEGETSHDDIALHEDHEGHAGHDHTAMERVGEGDQPLRVRLYEGVKYGVTTLFGDLLKWLVLGLLIAAAVEAWLLPTGLLEQWGQGPVAMLVMLVIGIPMYICATSSTPLAAALLAGGVSPGAVLVLLLAGPATNVSTFGVMRQELGMRAAVTAIVTLAIASLLLGWLTNVIVGVMQLSVQGEVTHHHAMLPMWVSVPALAVLVVIALMVKLGPMFKR